MHSNLHLHLARSSAVERVQAAARVQRRAQHLHPPPLRGRAASAAARVARRLDADAARKAIA